MQAQGVLRLSQGVTLQQTADKFMVHLNSLEQWRQRRNNLDWPSCMKAGHTGQPRTWTQQQKQEKQRRHWAGTGCICITSIAGCLKADDHVSTFARS